MLLPLASQVLLSSSLPGWTGPYLTGILDDRRTGLSGYRVDPWSRDYNWSVSGDQLTLASAGTDGTLATSDDIELVIDVTLIRRRVTLDRIERLQIVINQYNAVYLTADPLTSQPLPADFAQILTALTTAGLIPTSSGLDVDGWGNAFVPSPLVSPVLSVTSSSL